MINLIKSSSQLDRAVPLWVLLKLIELSKCTPIRIQSSADLNRYDMAPGGATAVKINHLQGANKTDI